MKARILFQFVLALLVLVEVKAQVSVTYTSSGSFVVPAGVTEVTVECWGGGGRGGSRTSGSGAYGGGGGGAYARSVLAVTPSTSYTVTVGTGSNSNSNPGGDSWFGTNTTIRAKGGSTVPNNDSNGAEGGASASCIGDIVFQGGSGANGNGANGGGGGSSAGGTLQGTNAAGASGAVAPLGGGNGGNGRTISSGNGLPGNSPGGGGGGSYRNSGGNRSGGNGAAGQVVVTYNFPTNTCVTAHSSTALPDNGCASNRGFSVQIPVSGLPATLGSDPGNAVLSRVEVIINHTYNRDINLRLTSPSGQSRDMVLNRFGSGDNFGNPGTCPAAPFVLQDGGAPLVDANTSNVTGPYAPQESLSGFTGDPNGTWTLFVCDNEAADVGNLRFVNLVFGVLDCEGILNGPAGPGTACSDGDPTTVNDTWTNDCVCQGDPNILYSLSSGDYTANIWSYTPGGPAAGVIPNQHSSIVIRSGHSITLSGTRQARSFTIESGGSFALGSGTFTVNGTVLANDGSFNGGTGTLILAGVSNVNISGSAPFNLFNLTVTNTAGATVDASVDVRNALTLSAGTFTANVPVRFVSTANRTGRLAPVDPSASYVGNIIMERHIPGGATNWRLLGSPVQNATMAGWNDDFFTAGFPGSNYPNFYSGGVLWPSVRWYDETNTGAGINDGLVGVSGNAHVLTPGRGFATWSGDGNGGTNAFTVDVTGPPTIASSPITLPMTFTNTGVSGTDGWNLVSNPLPSPISFTAISRGADVQNAYWVFNPANGNNASWSAGLGTNSANGIIQSSQGFWLKANGSAITTTLTESAKATSQSGGIFGGQEQLAIPMVRLAISSSINGYRDEAVVAFHEGDPGTDDMDARSFVFAHPQAPQISTLSADGDALAISMYGAIGNNISIPVRVDVALTGTYTITASDMGLLGGLSCLTLEDLVTGAITPMLDSATYSFTIGANANATTPRFMLHATAPLVFNAQDAACANAADGRAEVLLVNGPTDVVWSDASGTVLLSQAGMPAGAAAIEGLPAGNYQVTVGTSTACGALTHLFTITEPFGMEAQAGTTAASCADASDGSIALEVLGGVAPYIHAWSNGATTPTLESVPAGEYAVTIVDANGCATTLEQLVVDAPDAIIGEVIADVAVAANETILFASSAPQDLQHMWDFGDGNTSTQPSPMHNYSLPGEYTVTLTLVDGDCSRAVQHTVSVFVSTGVGDLESNGLQAWYTGTAIVLVNNSATAGDVQVYDAAGQLVATERLVSGTERMEINTADWPTGIYHLSVTNKDGRWSIGLPIVR